MTPEEIRTAPRMTSVKAAWDKSPAGPRKDRALRHYKAAETADNTRDEARTNKELDAAIQALS